MLFAFYAKDSRTPNGSGKGFLRQDLPSPMQMRRPPENPSPLHERQLTSPPSTTSRPGGASKQARKQTYMTPEQRGQTRSKAKGRCAGGRDSLSVVMPTFICWANFSAANRERNLGPEMVTSAIQSPRLTRRRATARTTPWPKCKRNSSPGPSQDRTGGQQTLKSQKESLDR